MQLLLSQHGETAVSVLDLRTEANRLPGVAYYEGDITRQEDVAAALRGSGAQVVINTVSPVTGLGNARVYTHVNVGGTHTLLDAAARARVPVFIYTSSAGVVTDNVHDLVNASETSAPVVPDNPDAYSNSKVKYPPPPSPNPN